MTFIYWAGVDYGKHHLQEYAKANRKSFTKWHKTSAKKFSYTNDKQIKEYYYKDETNRTEEDIIDKRFELRSYTNYIKYIPRPKEYLERQKNKRKRDIFTDIKKCLPTDIIFPLYGIWPGSIMQCNSYNGYKGIINDWGHMTEENIHFLRNCNNIVPYKEDILDSAMCKLDKFYEYTHTPYKHDVVKAHKENKNYVWIFLDNLIFTSQQYIEQLLQQYNIPYTYFNLDKDNYNEVFGWEIVVDRDVTHPHRRWDDNEKYNLIKNIAEEYIIYNKKGDTRL